LRRAIHRCRHGTRKHNWYEKTPVIKTVNTLFSTG
jgi:hypothetical protein